MLTFNSGKTLRRALESVKDFDDIILCDGGSTDETLEIAREYGARVIMQDAQYVYPEGGLADGGGARNQMMNAAKHDWYLWIDSDESVSQDLRDDVARICRTPYREGDPLAYRIPIRIIIDGHFIKYSSNYPGYQYRFFNRKSGGHLTRRAHNRTEFAPGTPIGTLQSPWFVYVASKDIRILGGSWKHYRRVEIEEAGRRTFKDFVRYIIWWHLRAAAGITLKSLYQYLRHGFRDTMPVSAELARALSPLVLIVNSTAYRIRNLFS